MLLDIRLLFDRHVVKIHDIKCIEPIKFNFLSGYSFSIKTKSNKSIRVNSREYINIKFTIIRDELLSLIEENHVI